MTHRILTLVALVASLAAVPSASARDDDRSERREGPGAVYTMSNATAGNAILVFGRSADGALVAGDAVATGGMGTGAGLGNQGGLVLTRNQRWLLAVNAGSNSVSVFEVRPQGLRLVDVEPTGGVRPISVTEHRGVVYVVHAGNDTIAGFTLSSRGQLSPLADSVHGLSSPGAGPAQIAFTLDGGFLLVTEKANNRITIFTIDRRGRPVDRRAQDASGMTPFGFAFGKRHQVFVTEAFGGEAGRAATSSYLIDADGTLSSISPSVATNQTAACWAVLTPNGKYAYVTNAGSGSISGYAVDGDGRIALLNEDGRTGVTGAGSTPIDMAIANNGTILYNLNAGSRTIGAFRLERDGSLTPLAVAVSVPAGTNGLVAR